MALLCHPRENLVADLTAAVSPDAPGSLLVVFRLGGFNEFMARSGNTAVERLVDTVVAHITAAIGPDGAFYRSRKDELCGIVSGRLDGVESALFAAAASVNSDPVVRRTGITIGYGTAVLPHEASDPVAALTVADQRVIGFADGQPLSRGSGGGFLPLGKLVAA